MKLHMSCGAFAGETETYVISRLAAGTYCQKLSEAERPAVLLVYLSANDL